MTRGRAGQGRWPIGQFLRPTRFHSLARVSIFLSERDQLLFQLQFCTNVVFAIPFSVLCSVRCRPISYAIVGIDGHVHYTALILFLL